MPDFAFSTAEAHRVLVVEDEYLVAIDLANSLEDVGIEVVRPAGSLDEALELLHSSGRLDAAILDINVRNQLIYPVADALVSREVPFLFTTGYDTVVIPLPYATVPRCQKPVEMKKLIRWLSGLGITSRTAKSA